MPEGFAANFAEEVFDEDAIQEAREELAGKSREVRQHPFIYACKLTEIPKNGSRGKVIFCEHDEVALFYILGKVYAISNICPHQASPLLSEGHVDKEALTVACPLHGWTYSIATGKSVLGDSSVTSYAVKVLENEVWIEEPPFREITLVTLG